jgi:predicted acylesterase/phospholipase RssA
VTQETKGSYRILTLDGGGSKGFYTLGVLKELEAKFGSSLHNHFDMVYGTSTGSIISALIALGHDIDTINTLYKDNVTKIMHKKTAAKRSRALAQLTDSVFEGKAFTDPSIALGIVATKWDIERPMIFKTLSSQAHGRKSTFEPGFGITISDAVQASCSAYPFFKSKTVTTADGSIIELIDGGFCANNPSLFALADATAALGYDQNQIKVLTVGVGVYPKPKQKRIMRMLTKTQLYLDFWIKTMEINSQTMEQLRSILYKKVQSIRISDTFHQPEMATGFLESDLSKLNTLYVRGKESFAKRERDIELFISDK